MGYSDVLRTAERVETWVRKADVIGKVRVVHVVRKGQVRYSMTTGYYHGMKLNVSELIEDGFQLAITTELLDRSN